MKVFVLSGEKGYRALCRAERSGYATKSGYHSLKSGVIVAKYSGLGLCVAYGVGKSPGFLLQLSEGFRSAQSGFFHLS